MDEVKLWADKNILIAMVIGGVILLIGRVTLMNSTKDFLTLLVSGVVVTLLFMSWLAVFIDLMRVNIHNKSVWFIGLLFSPLQPLFVILYLLNRDKNLRLSKRFKAI